MTDVRDLIREARMRVREGVMIGLGAKLADAFEQTLNELDEMRPWASVGRSGKCIHSKRVAGCVACENRMVRNERDAALAREAQLREALVWAADLLRRSLRGLAVFAADECLSQADAALAASPTGEVTSSSGPGSHEKVGLRAEPGRSTGRDLPGPDSPCRPPVATCPCCGSPVRVHTSDEGTSRYEPLIPAGTIEKAQEALLARCRYCADGHPLNEGTEVHRLRGAGIVRKSYARCQLAPLDRDALAVLAAVRTPKEKTE